MTEFMTKEAEGLGSGSAGKELAVWRSECGRLAFVKSRGVYVSSQGGKDETGGSPGLTGHSLAGLTSKFNERLCIIKQS